MAALGYLSSYVGGLSADLFFELESTIGDLWSTQRTRHMTTSVIATFANVTESSSISTRGGVLTTIGMDIHATKAAAAWAGVEKRN